VAVDVDAATRRNILVTNVPNDWCENEVADHAMALTLAMARKLRDYDNATRAGIWRWQSGEPIHRLRGSTLGLLSFGPIVNAASEVGRVLTGKPPLSPVNAVQPAAGPA
jgi:D-3-phosphoglycerate dehydrogenase